MEMPRPRAGRTVLAYALLLFAGSASAGPLLDRDRTMNAPQPAAAPSHSSLPAAAADMDVPEPATYMVVGTVLITFSVIGHVLRRRRIAMEQRVSVSRDAETPGNSSPL